MAVRVQTISFRRVMPSPAVSEGTISQVGGAIQDEVNEFLATLNPSDVLSVTRSVDAVGKYGHHMMVAYQIVYRTNLP